MGSGIAEYSTGPSFAATKSLRRRRVRTVNRRTEMLRTRAMPATIRRAILWREIGMINPETRMKKSDYLYS